jgi:hypothetical protein
MADYKELLRRAVEALPENNGGARRAVYEKARAALVGQLRAINPPLPARDITTHRLQLEDCIRQVEQEASEANIAGIGSEPAAPPTLPPVFASEAKKPVQKPAAEAPKPAAKTEPPKHAPARPAGAAGKANGAVRTNSIEDIIAAAERDRGAATSGQAKGPEIKARPPKSQPVLVAKSEPPAKPEPKQPPANKPLPSIVARAEAAKGRPAAANFSIAADAARRAPSIEPRRDNRGAATARQMQALEFDVPEDVAMTAVREVEVEQQPADPQRTIDRAIAALESEARGEAKPAQYADTEVELDDEQVRAPQKKNGFFNGRAADMPEIRAEQREIKTPRPAKEFANPRRPNNGRAFPDGMPRQQQRERGGLGAVTIFLIIFVALLVGAGGAGFWAWQEGFINLDAMFGKGGTPAVATAATNQPAVTPDSTGPGNTDTPVATAEPSTELKTNERLGTEDQTAAATTGGDTVAPLALQSPGGDGKTEERLGTDQQPKTAEEAVAAIDPASVAGSQSLLLEASDNGTTGAVPFSGTVDWSKGVDENGQPTLVGKANIPARNLSVDVLIRKNSDPSLPASHLMEINFSVSDSFIGGSIAGLPGVLLKNEELVQGAPLVGASARVVGNSFLFALSATPEDSAANVNLLTSRKWMDLALIYASGKRAIITLEKDDKAEKMFSDVFAAWGKTSAG